MMEDEHRCCLGSSHFKFAELISSDGQLEAAGKTKKTKKAELHDDKP